MKPSFSSFSCELEKIGGPTLAELVATRMGGSSEHKYRSHKSGLKSKTAEVRPYQQKTQWSCSAACLKAVLDHHGIKKPELECIHAVGARKNKGAETTQIVDAAKAMGYDAYEKSFSSMEEALSLVNRGYPIICDIQSFKHKGKGHYVVLAGGDAETVHIMDPNAPELGNVRLLPTDDFEGRWWDRWMKPPHDLMVRWGVVVMPRKSE